MAEILTVIRKELELPEDYKKAKKILDDYKRLRASMGKPIRSLNPDQIKEDLTGHDFISLIEEIENVRKQKD